MRHGKGYDPNADNRFHVKQRCPTCGRLIFDDFCPTCEPDEAEDV